MTSEELCYALAALCEQSGAATVIDALASACDAAREHAKDTQASRPETWEQAAVALRAAANRLRFAAGSSGIELHQALTVLADGDGHDEEEDT